MSGDFDCDEALAKLYAYLDSELDNADAEKIRTHLAGCGWCDRPFDFERRLREVVRRKLDEEIPESVIIRIRTVLAFEARH